jgi:predicted glycosyl hydrolase (DUF1957 family)
MARAMSPKTVSFILHLYQPSVQSNNVVKQIYESSYNPLLKILKNNKNSHITLNMPLSFLELMDTYGYSDWIADVAKLYELGKIEITGSAAYHPLLSQFDKKIVEDEIILNEYGLGYYFGKRTGFEGEKSILLKDVTGFFSPELAVNENVLNTISDLGYEWALVDSCALPNQESTDTEVEYKNGLKLVIRNTELSNKIAFYRGFDTSSILQAFNSSSSQNIYIALDGETFGHHNKDGILYFDSLIDALSKQGIALRTVTDVLSGIKNMKKCENIVDSSWGASKEDILNGDILPFWKNENNTTQQSIWQLNKYVESVYLQLQFPKSIPSNLENVALWKNDFINKLENPELQKFLVEQFSYLRLLMSDALWWVSGKALYNNDVVLDTDFVKKYIALAQTVADMTNDTTLKEHLTQIESKL